MARTLHGASTWSRRTKPMSHQPSFFPSQSLAARSKGPEYRTIDRFEVGQPLARGIRLDVGAAAYRQLPKRGQVNCFAIDTADFTAGRDDQQHGLRPPAAEDVPPRPIDEQAVQHRLHPGKLGSN